MASAAHQFGFGDDTDEKFILSQHSQRHGISTARVPDHPLIVLPAFCHLFGKLCLTGKFGFVK